MSSPILPGAYRADLAVINPFTTCASGSERALRVALRNLGTASWPAVTTGGIGPVTLGAHLHATDGALITDGLRRVALPYDVSPGGGLTLTLPLCLDATLPAGEYTLYIDLVLEGLGWFAALGSEPATLRFTLRPAARVYAASPLVTVAGRALAELGLCEPSAEWLSPVARALRDFVPLEPPFSEPASEGKR
jgi:hypothetical protein